MKLPKMFFPKNPPTPPRSRIGFFGFQSHPKRIGMDRGFLPFQSDIPGFLGVIQQKTTGCKQISHDSCHCNLPTWHFDFDGMG